MARRPPSHFAWKLSLSLLVLVVLAITLLASNNLRAMIAAKEMGTLGASFITAGNQRYEIVEQDPHSPLAGVGAKKGDLVRFARKSDRLRVLRAGEAVAITLYTSAGARDTVIKAVPDPALVLNERALTAVTLTSAVSALFSLGLSLAIGLRMAGSLPMRGLSLALLADSANFSSLTLPASALQDGVTLYLSPLAYGLTALSFLYFALTFPQSAPWLQRTAIKRFFSALAAALACSILLTYFDRYGGLGPVASELAQRGRNFIVMVICASAMIALYASWRSSEGAIRYRMAWIGACLSAVLVAYFVPNIFGFLNVRFPVELDSMFSVFATAAYAGLGYGLLRHRLLNISFAINRTLVFTVTSLMLFLAFWLIEQVVHKLVHFDAAANNALLGGAIAFGLFFAFNRLHHRVEHWIEHLFFREWRAREQGLRQFMSKAAHFLAPEALLAAFGAALDRFSDQAGHAIYLIGHGQQFDLACSNIAGAPPNLSVDGDIAVTLRDTRGLMRLDASHREVPGALVLPMLQGSLLKGFVVMGTKADSQGYRPDEEDVLQAAVARIALDMASLEAEKAARDLVRMEQERQVLLQRQGFLEQELAALHLVLSNAVQAPDTRVANLA